MRRITILLPLLLLTTLPVQAQVSVDLRALDALAPPKPAASPAPQTPAPSVAKPVVKPVDAAVAKPSLPGMASAPPPTPSLPPALNVPTRPAAPAEPPKLVADSPTRVEPLKSGLRVVFGVGRSDINAATEQAIRSMVHGDPAHPGSAAPPDASFTITCYAAGTPEDPSTPRRTSLSRALAIRSLLIAQGIASVRIYVRALGPSSPGFSDGPSERGDVIMTPNPIVQDQPWANSPAPTKH